MADPKQTLRAWFDDMDANHDPATAERFFMPDATLTTPGRRFKGTAEIAGFLDNFFTAFPDLSHTIPAMASEGDVVMTEFSAAGTHSGPFRTPEGDIPPTGKRIALRAVSVGRVENGRFAELRVYFDGAGFMAQFD